ncbi:MAG: hypothetical protein WBK79_06190, partial [Candidatus Cloacimonas acidaminovorans]
QEKPLVLRVPRYFPYPSSPILIFIFAFILFFTSVLFRQAKKEKGFFTLKAPKKKISTQIALITQIE